MAVDEPSTRLRWGEYRSTTEVPGFMTLGQCPRVVHSQSRAPSKVQMRLDLGICNHSVAESLPTYTNTSSSISGIQRCPAGQWNSPGSIDQAGQAQSAYGGASVAAARLRSTTLH